MDITQTYIDDELALSKKILIYYTDKLTYYSGIGSNQYHKWYVDSLQLYCLTKYIENIILYSGVCYMGAEALTNDQLLQIFQKVREYYKSDIDVDYEIADIVIEGTPTYIRPFIADWKEFKLTITEDNTTTVTLPVSIDIMDKESIQMTVNSISDPDYNSNIELDGYHIVANTLYWHTSNFYNLMAGTKIRIQYLQIVG